jgi:hypothetical protein
VIYRQREVLDAVYIRHWLRAFAEILDRPEMLNLFEKPWRKAQGKS